MTITKDLTKYNKSDSSYRKPIDRIVIHWFGIGTLDSALGRFKSENGGASAHYLVSGSKIVQCVDESEVAWHAGNWAMNQRSIGIEHDATAPTDANPHNLSEESYKSSAQLIADICKRHSIPLDRTHIIKHSEVTATQCCGTVDVLKLIELAKGFMGADPCSERVAVLEKDLDEMRDSRNTWKTDSKNKAIEIAALQTEVKNREEQVGRLKDLVTLKEATITDLLGKIEVTKPLQEEIQTLQKKLDEFAKAKGLLEIENTKLKEQIGLFESQPTAAEKAFFQKLVDSFFAWLKGKNGNATS